VGKMKPDQKHRKGLDAGTANDGRGEQPAVAWRTRFKIYWAVKKGRARSELVREMGRMKQEEKLKSTSGDKES